MQIYKLHHEFSLLQLFGKSDQTFVIEKYINMYIDLVSLLSTEKYLSQNKLFLAKFEDTTVEVKSLRVN